MLLLELDTFANESDVMWRGFVASAIAAVSLQWVNPFGTAKLVLFQVSCKLLKIQLVEFHLSRLPSCLIGGVPLNWYDASMHFVRLLSEILTDSLDYSGHHWSMWFCVCPFKLT